MSDISQVSIDLAAVRYWSILGSIALAFAIMYFLRRRGTWWNLSPAGAVVAAIVLLAGCTWTAAFGRVQPGARGVVLRFGAPTGRTLGEGLYAIVPFADRVVSVNTQVNTIHFDRAQGTCHDLEPVYANLDVTFHVRPDRAIDVYRELRANYAARIVRPAVLDAWKAAVSTYAASDLIDRREAVQRTFRSDVARRIAPFGLSLDAVSTTRFNFAYAYAQAAQLKVASEQRTLQAEQELARIKIESQQGVIRARSEVEALKLQRNIPVAQLMRMRELELERRAIDKWDGHLPQTTTSIPFLGGTLGSNHPD